MSNKPDSEVSDKKFAERLERQANDGHRWNKAPDMLREAAVRIRRLTTERDDSRATLRRAEYFLVGQDYLDALFAIRAALDKAKIDK